MVCGRISAGFVGLAACFWMAAPLSGQSIEDQRRALASATALAARSADRAEQLEARATAEAGAAAQAEAKAAAIAARIQASEADIAKTELRLILFQKMREHVRAQLADRQRPALRLTAALQALSSRPQALAFVQPGSMHDLVHIRLLLAALTPELQRRTAGLRADLQKIRRLESDTSQTKAQLEAGRYRLRQQQLALIRLEAAHRAASARFAGDALSEQDQALAMGEKARDLVDLIDQLGRQSVRQTVLAQLPGPILRPDAPDAVPAPLADARVQPASRLAYRLPVMGTLVAGLGEVSATGARAKGLTFQVQPQAQIVAPQVGRIVFAGSFRGYGQIVIIDHGNGWTSLVTHLSVLQVAVGQKVILGSPIGRAGGGKPRITIELRRSGRPVDITHFVT